MKPQYQSLKHLSSLFFGCNYIALIYNTITLNSQTDEQQKVYIDGN